MAWDKFKQTKAVEMVGKRFFSWLVVERSLRDGYGNIMWRCRCDCGKEKIVSGASLRSGKTKSCGCSRKEKS